jgi:hypothetical protein
MYNSQSRNRLKPILLVLVIALVLTALVFVVVKNLQNQQISAGFTPLQGSDDTIVVLFPECDLAVTMLKGYEYSETKVWGVDFARQIKFSPDNYFVCHYRKETMAEKLDIIADPTISYLPVNRLPSTDQNLQNIIRDKRKAIYGLPSIIRYDFILENKTNRVYSYGYTYEFVDSINPIVQIQPISLANQYPNQDNQ